VHEIDVATWPRKTHFEFFCGMEQPHFGITSELDTTGARARWKAQGVGVFAGIVHAVTGAANAVPQLRQRIRVDGDRLRVVEHDVLAAGYTVGTESELFNYGYTPWMDDLGAFSRHVRAESERMRTAVVLEPNEGVRDNLLYISSIPWLNYTGLTQPVAGRMDSVPRVCWSKMSRRGDREILAVTLQVHHALVDGRHVAAFYERLRAILKPD